MNSNQYNYKHPKVSIILLNWNNPDDTIECLESLKQITYPHYDIIVVDNHSTDDSIIKLESIDNIFIIKNDSNVGFAGGNNVGIEYALKKSADYVLLLNNDTVVDKDFLSNLIKKIQPEKEVGIVGGKIYYYDDPQKIWAAGGGITKFAKRTFQYGENKKDAGQFNTEKEVDFISGCCMLVRKEVFEKIGVLDKAYFMYYEDVDFCLRTKKYFGIKYVPTATIWHKVSGTSIKSFRDYYRMRNYFLLLNNRYEYSFIKIVLVSLPVLFERLSRILLKKIIFKDTEKILYRISALFNGFTDGVKL